MKFAIVLSVCLSVALAWPARIKEDPAAPCSSDCQLPACKCSTGTSPLELDNTPQLISLTFDESVVENIYEEFWLPILDRTNPDGEQIGATFFVPHEYTDYSIVNKLYNAGFEIAVHSVTKNPLQSYWKNATEDILYEEFSGQREIISKFANIPIDEVIGARAPQLQINGNVSIRAYQRASLQYDSSQPTLRAKPLFPYTLDYASTQQCLVAAYCPTESFPGFWVLPIVNLMGNEKECNAIGDCEETGSADEIKKWLEAEVQNVKTSRAPLIIRISTLWFSQVDNAMDGFLSFLDDLANQKDVFLVSNKQILDWIKSPVAVADFRTEVGPDDIADCEPINCKLQKSENEIRYMKSCVDCPDVYPWLGNPGGDRDNITSL